MIKSTIPCLIVKLFQLYMCTLFKPLKRGNNLFDFIKSLTHQWLTSIW